ncbi:hypothetical protein PQQ65_05045 [Paraburkholderia strydomiana]|uniref:hypothetical protein n=1 Tax=Paraburkholderia strydomiana TaxID=1245417 RepID=UPI0038BAC75B
MNLATIKQQEDLKARLAPIVEKIRARENGARYASASAAFDAFRSFFGAHGFTVHAHMPDIVTATYGEAAYRLEYDQQNHDMKLLRPGKPIVNVRFVGKGYKGPQVTINAVTPRDPNPVAELTKQVAEAEAMLQGPTPTFWYYPSEVAHDRIVNNFGWRTYEHFSDLLSALCDS